MIMMAVLNRRAVFAVKIPCAVVEGGVEALIRWRLGGLRINKIAGACARESRAVLQVSPYRDQRHRPLQAKRVEGAKTPAVQDDLDYTKKSDL